MYVFMVKIAILLFVLKAQFMIFARNILNDFGLDIKKLRNGHRQISMSENSIPIFTLGIKF